MKRYALSLVGAVLAASLGWSAAAPRHAAAAAAPRDARYVPGEIVVSFRSAGRLGSPIPRARALARKVGGRVARVTRDGASTVIKAAAGADVRETARRLGAERGVRYAEPNYIYGIAGTTPPYVVRRTAGGRERVAVPKTALRSMRLRTAYGVKATYPSDALLWDNGGWDWISASIVWGNTTPSKNVCLIDTGVDYTHPDLSGRIIKGKDRVSEDADPMDDHGHGTHLAGIIAAKQNNTEGIAGVSPTAKVVAVKAMNADGLGTGFDIWQSIRDCADRSDVSIISMSFAGPYSAMLKDAVDYATITKKKLLVAAAGTRADDPTVGTDMPYCDEETISSDLTRAGVRSYPAGFAISSYRYSWDPGTQTCVPDTSLPPEDENLWLHRANPAVLSVGASGAAETAGDYSCRAAYSNYGSADFQAGPWVTITAPGTGILSTTPWDKPFTMNAEQGTAARYDYLDGTSVAAAFVAGAAARAWGYLPAPPAPQSANEVVAQHLIDTGDPLPTVGNEDFAGICTDESLWPGAMAGATGVNVAAALERGALYAEAFDAVSGLPLMGATVQALQGSPLSVKSSAVVSAVTVNSPDSPEPYKVFPAGVDLLNLPAGWDEGLMGAPAPPTARLSGPVPTSLRVSKSGYTATAAYAFVGGEEGLGQPDGTINPLPGMWLYAGYAAVPQRSARFTVVSAWDLWRERQQPMLATTLPDKIKEDAINDDQPLDFVVGFPVCADAPFNPLFPMAGDAVGELSVFPHAQAVYQNRVDTHLIAQRASAAALPRWTGTYRFSVFNEAKDFDVRVGSLFFWKDGYLKKRVDKTGAGCAEPGSQNDWWAAATLTSGKSGSVKIEAVDECVEDVVFPCLP